MKNHLLKKFLSKKNSDEEKTRSENFQDIIFNKNREIFIKIPFIVFGELFNNINNYHASFDENCISSINNEIFSLFDRNNVDLVPPEKKSYSLANEIIQKDSRFDSTDALIVSQSLIDKNSVFMATMDYTITESFGGGIIARINDRLYNNKERFKKLKIYG
jgi:hypothetical protein